MLSLPKTTKPSHASDPGTPMGQLMRQYWIPFLTSSDVVRDGAAIPCAAAG
jgi:hypothetical protein